MAEASIVDTLYRHKTFSEHVGDVADLLYFVPKVGDILRDHHSLAETMKKFDELSAMGMVFGMMRLVEVHPEHIQDPLLQEWSMKHRCLFGLGGEPTRISRHISAATKSHR
jgi:hypothetical protein